jgi:acyl-CoA thioesterase FadM
VTITSSIVEVGGSSFKVRHQLFLGDTLCVEGNEVRVWTVRDPATGAIKGARIPDEVRARFVA